MKNHIGITQKFLLLTVTGLLGSAPLAFARLTTAPAFPAGKIVLSSDFDSEQEYDFQEGTVSGCKCSTNAYSGGTSLQSSCYCRVTDCLLGPFSGSGAKFKFAFLNYREDANSKGDLRYQSWSYSGKVEDAGAASLVGEPAYFNITHEHRMEPNKARGSVVLRSGMVKAAIRSIKSP